MAFKPTEAHWDLLLNYMGAHKEFARGQFSGPSGKSNQKKMWNGLTSQLNALGGCMKPVEKWQKTWSDLKYKTKSKASALKRSHSETGGGPALITQLTTFEERVLSILGNTFYQGIGAQECGVLSECSKENITDNEILNISTRPTASFDKPVTVVQRVYPVSPVVEIVTPEIQNRIIDNDHSYDKPAKKSKLSHNVDSQKLYEDTVEELREIKSGVLEIGSVLKEISNSIKLIAEKIC